MDLENKGRPELLQICKDLHIKSVSTLKKEDLIGKIKENKSRDKLPSFLKELLQNVPKDKKRKLCIQCGEMNHSSSQCSMNKELNQERKEYIKSYFLKQDLATEGNHFETLSHDLSITMEECKQLYYEIPRTEWFKRPMDKLLSELPFISCQACHKKICTIQTNTARRWKDQTICDTCFSHTFEEREELWKQIAQYCPMKCVLCHAVKQHKDERFHLDHLNMFDKSNSVCTMVYEGLTIEEIRKEIDKCQVLCISCHHIVTAIERKTGFIRYKKEYTSEFLKQEENTKINDVLKQQYSEIIIPIYDKLRQKMAEINRP
jgi:hypothetical protein